MSTHNHMRDAGMDQTDAERYVLGAILFDGMTGGFARRELMTEAAGVLQTQDFWRAFHREVYGEMLDIASKGLAPDFELLDARLRGKAENYSIADLSELTTHASSGDLSTARFTEACRLVKESADRRWQFAMSEKLRTLSADRTKTPTEALELVRAEMDARRVGVAGGREVTMADMARDFRRNVEHWRATPFELRGISTGLKVIDLQTGGARPGALWVVGGRSSMGKTAFSLTMLHHGASETEQGHFVAMVSLEMSKEQLFLRMAAMESGESVVAIERGDPRVNWERVEDAVSMLEQLPIRILDAASANNRANGSRGRITPEEIRRRCQAWRHDGILDMLIVDYVELVAAPAGTEKLPREERLSEITKALKALAEEVQAPVVALSQLNRGTEDSESRIPTLANIRGSDAIANDADVVVFPVHWEYYVSRGQKVPPEVQDKPRGYCSVMVAKNRNGPVGMVEAYYLASQMRFCDFDAQRNCPVDYNGHVIPLPVMQGDLQHGRPRSA